MEMAMNRIEIEVLNSRAALAAFARAWRQTRARRKTTPRLAFGSIAELFSAVSEKRLELVRHVAGDEGLQIRPLARALGREYKNVHTDVQALIELGLLEKKERGGLRAPFDEIVIRAGLREAA
jgi:predicted transcriptional regulator